jgi:hypothetical protein
MNQGISNLKATAGTKLGGEKKRGGALKLFSDYKGAGGKHTEKIARKQSKKAV